MKARGGPLIRSPPSAAHGPSAQGARVSRWCGGRQGPRPQFYDAVPHAHLPVLGNAAAFRPPLT